MPFENRASYLFDENQCGDGLLDLGKRTFECTKRAITIPVMLLWAVYGAEFFGKLADGLMVETCGFFEQLARYSEFDLPFKPDTNIIVFRHIPESVRGLPVEEQNRLQKALRVALHREGKFYVTQAHIEDKDYLRLTIINPRTTTEHVTDLIETLRRLGRFST